VSIIAFAPSPAVVKLFEGKTGLDDVHDLDALVFRLG